MPIGNDMAAMDKGVTVKVTAFQELLELEKNVSDPEVIEYMVKIVVESLGSKANSCLDD